ncbi:TetR family transcriptional regulator [Rubrobacter xylanophilus]|uniref:TetR family transcriptional regulator n=1 Tax=Rubrobacter xylanophilus TaxID=49319 RepID=A0A510HFR7_9ACTN|nr:TetR/AcrR family transcriptional regulator [Rubrobacter xylanophilus]BBL78784.1 TetR family transcriptional regulator [Rubrobacter xylanophilus]
MLAAERLAARDGVSRLTLDAVAAEAGVSKGGLLYHFSGKEELVGAMVMRWIEDFERDVAGRLARERAGAGRWVRAYVGATFEPEAEVQAAGEPVGILAAAATNRELLEELRRCYREWQERLEDDGLDPALATLLRLAADGLWFSELFGLAPPSGELRAEVYRRMLSLASGEEGA